MVVLGVPRPDTTVFTIAPSRSLKVLTTQLGVEHDPDTGALPDALPGGRRLLLSSDFYTVYQSLGRLDGVDNLWCWSHIRRYFVRAGDAHPDLQAWTQAGSSVRLYRAHSALAAAPTATSLRAEAAAQFDTTLQVIDTERRAQAANAHLMHPAAVKVLATLDRGMGRPDPPPRVPRAAAGQQRLRARAARPGGGPQELLRLGLESLRRAGRSGLDHHRHRRTRRPQPAGLPGRLPVRLRPDRWHTALRHGAGPIPALGAQPRRPRRLGPSPRHRRNRSPERIRARRLTRRPYRR